MAGGLVNKNVNASQLVWQYVCHVISVLRFLSDLTAFVSFSSSFDEAHFHTSPA